MTLLDSAGDGYDPKQVNRGIAMGSRGRSALFVACLLSVAMTIGTGQASSHAKGQFAGVGPGHLKCPGYAFPVLAGEINVQGLLASYSNSSFGVPPSCAPGKPVASSVYMAYHGLSVGAGVPALHQGVCAGVGTYLLTSNNAATMSGNGSCTDMNQKTGATVTKPAHFKATLHQVGAVVIGTVAIS